MKAPRNFPRRQPHPLHAFAFIFAAMILASCVWLCACQADAQQDIPAPQSDAKVIGHLTAYDQVGETTIYNPDQLTADERINQVLSIAEKELGNEDGTRYEDDLLSSGGQLCYERGYWCTTFIWWAFKQAHMSDYFCDGTMTVYPQQQARFFQDQGTYHPFVTDDWQPERGDEAFMFYEDGFPGGELISHGELIESYDPEREEIHTISANPKVEHHTHSIHDEAMRGYGDLSYE